MDKDVKPYGEVDPVILKKLQKAMKEKMLVLIKVDPEQASSYITEHLMGQVEDITETDGVYNVRLDDKSGITLGGQVKSVKQVILEDIEI